MNFNVSFVFLILRCSGDLSNREGRECFVELVLNLRFPNEVEGIRLFIKKILESETILESDKFLIPENTS